jgi:hypothetical protein
VLERDELLAEVVATYIAFLDREHPWRKDALCREYDVELFFPVRGGGAPSTARAVCSRCAVSAECAQFAAEQGMTLLTGVWGGLSGRERRSLRAGRREAA